MTPGGERSGAGGRTCCSRPGGKGLGGNGLGGLVWVWVGLAWARYFALSLPTAAAAAAAGEASVARAGFLLRLRGVLGFAAWPAEAVARPAGAALATPRAPSSFSSAAVAAAGGDTYRIKVGHRQFRERHESQLRVREPDLRGQHVSLDYAAHEADSDDDYPEQDDYTVEKMLAQRPNASAAGGLEFKVRW